MRTSRVRRLVAGATTALVLALTGCGTATTTGDSTTAGATAQTAEANEATVAAVTTDNAPDHDEESDYEWDAADEVAIELSGASATSSSDAVTVDGGTVTITSAGTYRISGTLSDGRVVVDTSDDGVVRLVLDGVDITSSSGSVLAVLNAEKAVVLLEDGTENALTDAAEYTFPDAETDEPNAALFSAADLTIGGTGTLTVTGNYNDGIASKDGLVISGGTITVDAADDGIRGKDYLVIRGAAVLDVTAGGDGLKSDNAEDAAAGYVAIEAGVLTVDAAGDGIDAESDVLVHGGEVTVTAGGGASAQIAEDASAKGLKGTVSVVVDGGTLVVDSADDALHSNGSVTVSGGTLTVATGDDGIHADAALTVSGGTLTVTESYEGLESLQITISGGEIEVHSDDDGINVAGGVDGSGQEAAGNRQGGQVGGPMGGPGGDQFAALEGAWVAISGGTTVLYADGDGFDSNGSATMTGGTLLVHGPTTEMNGAIDVNGTFTVDGGLLVAAGSAGMAETPDDASTQAVLGISFGSGVSAGTEIVIQASDGTEVVSFTPAKVAATLVVSSPDLAFGTAYDVVVGGTSLGTVTAS